jgi:hypothetical protein
MRIFNHIPMAMPAPPKLNLPPTAQSAARPTKAEPLVAKATKRFANIRIEEPDALARVQVGRNHT